MEILTTLLQCTNIGITMLEATEKSAQLVFDFLRVYLQYKDQFKIVQPARFHKHLYKTCVNVLVLSCTSIACRFGLSYLILYMEQAPMYIRISSFWASTCVASAQMWHIFFVQLH